MRALKNNPARRMPGRMIEPRQIRSARALLGISQKDLAAECHLAEPTIIAIERGVSDPRASTLRKIQEVLEAKGIVFLSNGPGVRLRAGL